MSAPGSNDPPTVETFVLALGWRIPRRILDPLLHPAADTPRADASEDGSGTSEPASQRD